jgi:hypothetical protein
MSDPVTKELIRGCSGAGRGCVSGASQIMPTSMFISFAAGLRSVGQFFSSLFR